MCHCSLSTTLHIKVICREVHGQHASDAVALFEADSGLLKYLHAV